jgi:hypothetical protein
LVAASLEAQPRIVRGVVLDTADRPVPAVSIVFAGRTQLSDDSGRFHLEIPHRNKLSFDVRRVGYTPSRFALVAGGDTTLEIMMFPTVQKLDPVRVSEAAIERSLDIHGFNQRKQERQQGAGSGYYLSFRDLERISTPRVTMIFESNFPSLRTSPTGTTSRGLVSIDRSGGYCATHIWLDGIRLEGLQTTGAPNMRVRPRGGTPPVSSKPDLVNLDDLLLPSSIAGIEYYQSGAQAPQQYRPVNGNCGVVLIWTKAG